MTDDLYERYKEALRTGHVAVLRGQLDEAIAAYQLAASIAPARALPHASLGGVYLRLNRVDDALAEYAAAVARAPQDEGALLGQAEALAAVGRFADAAVALDRVAQIQEAAGRLPEATDTIRRALEFDEAPERVRRQRSLLRQIRLSAGDQAAEQALARALRLREEPEKPAAAADDATASTERGATEVAWQSWLAKRQFAPTPAPSAQPDLVSAFGGDAKTAEPGEDVEPSPEIVATGKNAADSMETGAEEDGAAIADVDDEAEPPQLRWLREGASVDAAGMATEEGNAEREATGAEGGEVETADLGNFAASAESVEPTVDDQAAAAAVDEVRPEALQAAGAAPEAAWPAAIVWESEDDFATAARGNGMAHRPDAEPAVPEKESDTVAAEIEAERDVEPVPVMAEIDPALEGLRAAPQPGADELVASAEEAEAAGDTEQARRLLVAAAREYAREGRYDAGLDAAHRLLRDHPSDVDVHLVLVELYISRNWETLAAEKLLLLGRLADLDDDDETRLRLCAAASQAFPDNNRLASLCA